jgi:hypothetical protein
LPSAFAVLAFLAQGLLHTLQLIAQVVEALCNAGFRHDSIFAQTAADIVGVALHVAGQLLLLHFAQRIAQFAGRLALCSGQVAYGALHLLFKILERIDLALAAIGELPRLLLIRTLLRIAEGTPQLAFEILLLAGDLFRLLFEIVDQISGLLPAQALQQLLGFLESFGGALGFSFALRRAGLLRRGGLAHALDGLLQAIESLTHLRGILAAGAGRRLALLTLLPLLALLALLPLLALLTLLALLPLLSLLTLLSLLLPLQLLDLALQLFGFAAEHLLLKALLRDLLILTSLVGELLLAPRQFLEFLQSFIDLLLAITSTATTLPAAFVLVLFGIELEVEEAFEVARAVLPAASPAASPVAERDLDIAPRGFGAQQVLQRLLLGTQRVFPVGAL